MGIELQFKKTGAEIKEALKIRIWQLKEQLDKCHGELDNFIRDQYKQKSARTHDARKPLWEAEGVALPYNDASLSIEERQELKTLCRRIDEIEQELNKFTLIIAHLCDTQEFDLRFDDLVTYGFEGALEVEEGF